MSPLPRFLVSSPRALAALAFARERHAAHRDPYGRPFLSHPLEVAELLAGAGADDDVVAAGLLHDVVEKGGAPSAEIRRHFGERVAGLVDAVTEDSSIGPYSQRKAALSATVAGAGPDAALVYAADKIAKVRELLSRVARDGASLLLTVETRDKLRHYRHAAAVVDHALGPHPLALRLRRELDAVAIPSQAPPPDRMAPWPTATTSG